MNWLSPLQDSLSAVGLNVSGVTDGRPYEEQLAGCRSVVVFASGGRALWEAFVADAQANPGHLTDHDHPFDDFVARAIRAADPDPPPSRRWIRCAAEPEAFLDFRPLALGAGLGWRSKTGLLLNPEHGLWLGMRAACLTTEVLPQQAALSGEGPCGDCPGYCADACPGGAFPEGRLQIRACAAFNVASEVCHGRCDARLACPEGAVHRHGPLQHHYHYARDTGRPMLAEVLGVEDGRSGLGPQWAAWSGEEP
ncbi:MAG: hypothetical protein ACI8S6_000459 [Myxococcota bacterium]|jgi:hypothetical protein